MPLSRKLDKLTKDHTNSSFGWISDALYWVKPCTKGSMLNDFIYIKFWNRQTHLWWELWGQYLFLGDRVRDWLGKGYEGTLWGDGNVLGICICQSSKLNTSDLCISLKVNFYLKLKNINKYWILIMCTLGLPWRSSDWDCTLPLQGVWVQSFVRELRSHMPCRRAKKKCTLKRGNILMCTIYFEMNQKRTCIDEWREGWMDRYVMKQT